MPPAARIGDFHVCPAVNPGPAPHVGGPVAIGSPNVITGKRPQARLGDMAVCAGPPDTIAKGSSGVFVNKKPAARIGDKTAHGGVIVVGFPTVIIGEKAGGGGGGAVTPMIFVEALVQADAMIAAAKTGLPFCEQCWRTQHGQTIGPSPPIGTGPRIQPTPEFSLGRSRPSPLDLRTAGSTPNRSQTSEDTFATDAIKAGLNAAGEIGYAAKFGRASLTPLASAASKGLGLLGTAAELAETSYLAGVAVGTKDYDKKLQASSRYFAVASGVVAGAGAMVLATAATAAVVASAPVVLTAGVVVTAGVLAGWAGKAAWETWADKPFRSFFKKP